MKFTKYYAVCTQINTDVYIDRSRDITQNPSIKWMIACRINPFCTKFVLGNTKITFIVLSILDTEMVQVKKLLPGGRKGPAYPLYPWIHFSFSTACLRYMELVYWHCLAHSNFREIYHLSAWRHGKVRSLEFRLSVKHYLFVLWSSLIRPLNNYHDVLNTIESVCWSNLPLYSLNCSITSLNLCLTHEEII